MKRFYTNSTLWSWHKIIKIILWITLIISNILIIKNKVLAEELPGVGDRVDYIKLTNYPEESNERDEEPTRSSYQGYDGSISSTYSEYFKGILYKLEPAHYLICRTGQYQYMMAYGDDLEYESGVFTGDVFTVIINTNTYNSNFSIVWGTDSDFRFTVNDNMIYSDLGAFPIINYQTSVTYQKGVLYFAAAVIIAIFLYFMFKRAFGRTIKFY